MGVTAPPTAANLEALVLLLSEGMAPAEAGERVFGAGIAWQTEATGEVWGTAEWAAATLEIPNAAHPGAPGRAVAGETRTVEWTGPDMLDARAVQRGDASADPQVLGILRARKDHWGMARDPARGFVEIVTERSPEKMSGAPIVSAPSDSVTATLDGAVFQELAFEGRRGQRAQVVSARTRGTPSRAVWAGWWGMPGAPFVQLVIGSATDIDRQIAPQATPDDIASLYTTR